eukprot:8324835-Karenia_brevis.AAC.1
METFINWITCMDSFITRTTCMDKFPHLDYLDGQPCPPGSPDGQPSLPGRPGGPTFTYPDIMIL